MQPPPLLPGLFVKHCALQSSALQEARVPGTLLADVTSLSSLSASLQAMAKNFLIYQFPSVTLSLAIVITVKCSGRFFNWTELQNTF